METKIVIVVAVVMTAFISFVYWLDNRCWIEIAIVVLAGVFSLLLALGCTFILS